MNGFRIFYLWAAFALPPLITRFFLLHKARVTDCAVDYFGGYLSSMGVGMFLVGLCFLPKRPRVRFGLGMVLSIGVAVVTYANFEHVLELDSALSILFIHFLKDAEFVRGSALEISAPALVAAIWILGPGLFLFKSGKLLSKEIPAKALLFCWGTAALAFTVTHVNANHQVRSWRLWDPIHENTIVLVRMIKQSVWTSGSRAATAVINPWAEIDHKLTGVDRDAVDRLFKADLQGELLLSPTWQQHAKKKNIVIIMIESMSGSYLPSFAGKYVDPDIKMLHLDQFSRERGLSFPNFVYNAKKTSRGEYTILCGDYDNIASVPTKMGLYIDEHWQRRCLPHVLAEQGYDSVYLQSANLTFMNKDLFMPMAGFGRYFGQHFFTNPYERNGWGVDDKTLYEHADKLIAEDLSHRGKPWLLTLLNTGTHHPGLALSGWENRFKSSIEGAYALAGEQVVRFVKQLDKRGLLGNTLVFVTGDEARPTRVASDMHRTLSTHWGFLSIFGGGVTPQVDERLFAQSDLAISILDYLGLATVQNQEFLGRSMFRSYTAPRILPFGVITAEYMWFYRSQEQLLTGCTINDFSCRSYTDWKESDFFLTDPVKHASVATTSRDAASLRYFLSRNEKMPVPMAVSSRVVLAPPHEINLQQSSQPHKIIHRSIGPLVSGKIIKNKVLIKVLNGEVQFLPGHYFTNDKTKERRDEEFDRVVVSAGQTYMFEFSSGVAEDMEEYLILLSVRVPDGPATIRVEIAESNISGATIPIHGMIMKKVASIKN